jgi:MYXO-CTERM domain-containing protein
MERWTWTLAMTGALTLLCGTAYADVVQQPPTNCPSGTEASTCHGGPYCGPTTCTTSTTCAAGTTCQDVSWCVTQLDCASGWNPTPSPQDNVLSACGTGGSCATGSCKVIRACVPTPVDAGVGSPPPRGCSCALGATASSETAAWGVLALGLGLALRALRRRS